MFANTSSTVFVDIGLSFGFGDRELGFSFSSLPPRGVVRLNRY
nr:Gamma-glutamyl phosphate reductase-Glutamate-5-semialdehyde dehydrogenase-Glutamyl-gamma-semialdehyde dehydrogenase [Moritella viscosa]